QGLPPREGEVRVPAPIESADPGVDLGEPKRTVWPDGDLLRPRGVAGDEELPDLARCGVRGARCCDDQGARGREDEPCGGSSNGSGDGDGATHGGVPPGSGV